MPNLTTPQPESLHQMDFTAIYNQYWKPIYNRILFMVGDEEHAADLTQDTFIKVYSSLSSHDPIRGTLLSWIRQIAKNTVIDQRRERGNRETRPVSLEWNTDEEAMHQMSRRAYCFQPELADDEDDLQALVQQLAPIQRQTLDLYYFQGLRCKQIAQQLNCSLPAVKSGIWRGKRELRASYQEWLERMYYGNDSAAKEGAYDAV